MSNITNTDAVVTESKLKDFYEDIKPFLGCPAYLTSEGTSDYYSTDEKVIGRWVDGKPLYQKVYSGTTASSGVTSFSIADLSIDKVIDVSGYVEYATNNFLFLSTFTNANDKGIGYASRINAFIDTSYTSKPYAMILKYTKTTDSASTTIQEDSNEYSTDEKIIGKWIDGKPIYQKTYQFNTVSTSNSLGMTINPENIINFFGTVTNVENECLTLNCAHPQYQDIYGLFACIKSSTLEVRSINGREWSLNNLRSLKITLQYTKDSD